VDETPVPRKVARLHLICDILHNSAATVPSAWKFRQEFQARLGIVFDHLANIYHSFPGRITADVFKKQITAVVDVWEDWIVFPPDFTSQLRRRLDGLQPTIDQKDEEIAVSQTSQSTIVSRFKSSTFRAADEPIDVHTVEDVDGEPLEDDVDGKPIDDVDGEPLDDDVDGVPMDDVDGVPMEVDDVDGEPLDDIDGAPMADDANVEDGEPMEHSDED
jgi:U2-associated protein SR140